MINGQKIVVVLPAYNAERTLEATVRELPDVVDQIILVDDHSTDETAALAQRLGLTVVVHEVNRGYGANQKTCYSMALAAGADVVVMVHPDYQYSPLLVTPMAGMAAYGVYDLVLGSRILGGQARRGGMPLYKYFANRALTFFRTSCSTPSSPSTTPAFAPTHEGCCWRCRSRTIPTILFLTTRSSPKRSSWGPTSAKSPVRRVTSPRLRRSICAAALSMAVVSLGPHCWLGWRNTACSARRCMTPPGALVPAPRPPGIPIQAAEAALDCAPPPCSILTPAGMSNRDLHVPDEGFRLFMAALQAAKAGHLLLPGVEFLRRLAGMGKASRPLDCRHGADVHVVVREVMLRIFTIGDFVVVQRAAFAHSLPRPLRQHRGGAVIGMAVNGPLREQDVGVLRGQRALKAAVVRLVHNAAPVRLAGENRPRPQHFASLLRLGRADRLGLFHAFARDPSSPRFRYSRTTSWPSAV